MSNLFIQFVTRRASILKSIVVIFVTISIVGDLNAQELVHEIAGDTYSLHKVQFDEKEVIFRPDRIEIFQNIKGLSEKSDFLIFENNKPEALVAVGEVKRTTKPFDNTAMAEVLGMENITSITYKSFIYKNIFNNVDLIISIKDGELNLHYSRQLLDGENPFLEFKLVGENLNSTSNKKSLTLSDQKTSIATFKAISSKIENDILSIDMDRSSEGKPSFSISIK